MVERVHDRNPRATSERGASRRPLTAAGTLGLVGLAGLLPVFPAGCGETPSEPVGALEVPETEVALPYPWSVILEAVYRPTASLDGGGEEADLLAFVHLLDAGGEIVRTFDHPFPGAWVPGERVVDRVELWQSALGPPLDPGRYTLTLGLEDRRTGRRLPLETEGEAVDDGEYAVVDVVVPEAGSGLGSRVSPELGFSGSWKEPRAGGDRQVLAVRALEAEGEIVLDGLGAPVDLTLRLLVPRPDESGFRLVLEEGAEAMTVTVRSPCADEPVRLTGPGEHRLELALRPSAPGAACRVRVEPSYTLVHPETFTRRTAALLQVSWVPRGDRAARADDA